MKSIITFVWIMLAATAINAQLKVSSGTILKTSGGVTIVLNDMELDNDGTINQTPGEGGFKFSGIQNVAIKGNSLPTIGILEVNKTSDAKLLLNRNININSSINFISGQLDLNNNNITLASNAYIAGESETNRITGISGGYIEITQDLNAPFSANPGNLGATLTSSANLGSVIIRRGHTGQNGTGLNSSIFRYYSILPQNNNALNAMLRLKYFDAEMNGHNENILVMYQSDDNGVNWNNLSYTSRNTNANYVEKTGIGSLSLQTLANEVSNSPVTGLVFNAKRKKATEVELTWSTQTETNMNGYEVQRRFANEADFSAISFVNSTAPGGNSNTPLAYLYTDANSYNGTTYYRLKVIDLNYNFIYSDIKSVGKPKGGGNGGGGNGNGNGGGGNNKSAGNTTEMESTLLMGKITVGPNPNNGNFWFVVNGIEKETVATLYTLDGKVLKQFRVTNQQQQQVNSLANGIYLLKVPGLDAFKVVVQGSSNKTTTTIITNNSQIKN